jgi:hypothetical protein
MRDLAGGSARCGDYRDLRGTLVRLDEFDRARDEFAIGWDVLDQALWYPQQGRPARIL